MRQTTKSRIARGTPAAELAQWLRSLREEAGLTYRAMADKLDGTPSCSYATLSRADRGQSVPAYKTVEGYVHACGGDLATATRLWKKASQNRSAAVRNPRAPMPSRHARPVMDPELIPNRLALLDALRQLYLDANKPSLRWMVEEAARRELPPLARSTLSDVLGDRARRLPALETFRTIITILSDSRSITAWVHAYGRITYQATHRDSRPQPLQHDPGSRMLAAGLYPLTEFPGNSNLPWEARCLTCNYVSATTLARVVKGVGCRYCRSRSIEPSTLRGPLGPQQHGPRLGTTYEGASPTRPVPKM